MAISSNIRVMTYNVHRCCGRDGKTSPERIAGIIKEYNAGIVALQELDVNQQRTSFVDQPKEIAKILGMHYHFFPSFQPEQGGLYGNAILSSYPMQVKKTENLPAIKTLSLEPRSAIWVNIQAGEHSLNFVTTHLGLKGKERVLQIKELLGENWLESSECQGPVIFCGDFNVGTYSKVYRMVGKQLADVQKQGFRPQATLTSRFPFFRVDHIFVTEHFIVNEIVVPRTILTKAASDHLPLITSITLC